MDVGAFQNPGPDQFVVEGRWCVEALLDCGKFRDVTVIRAEDSCLDFDGKYRGVAEIETVPKGKLREIAGYAFHRGIMALANRPAVQSIANESLTGTIVVCPCLADESNLGTIIRSAAALGVSALLVPLGRGADVYSRKAIRASSGAVFRLPVFECPDLAGDIKFLKYEGFFVFATALRDDSIPINQAEFCKNSVVLFGPEKGGLEDEWISLADATLKIPMAGGIDSLNVAASAAVVLYQISIGRRT